MCSFVTSSVKNLDLFIETATDVNKENDLMFRSVCKEVFRKSYFDLESKHNWETVATLAGVAIGSIIKKARNKYKKGSFTKTTQRVAPQKTVLYSEVHKLYRIIDDSNFTFVLKLLEINYKFDIKEALSRVSTIKINDFSN